MSDDEQRPSSLLIRRRNKEKLDESNSNFTIGSELEDETPRKPSRVSIAENHLTIDCDTRDATPSRTEWGTPSPSTETRVPNVSTGFLDYIWTELTRGYSLDNDQARFTEKRRKVYTFMRIPVELEKFLFYGLLQCIDAFFYLFTFLPIRFVMSICGFVMRLRPWTSAETCDLLKVGIILFSSLLVQKIDTSVLYHQVRGQGVIKLYIFYNMLEVADRLFSSLGQDVLDALFWTANERFTLRNVVRTAFHFGAAIIYAAIHAFLVLLQATTLNVAFNSHNQALLAIMMSNNFVELKGSVFKKFAKANLFQMACSDVRERFHIMALLFVVMVRNMMAVNWNIEQFGNMLPDIIMVVGAELLVDWLKHAFITKFNEINSEVYKDFTITISFDVVRSRDASAFSDYSDQKFYLFYVSRRMGFIPIPLSIMLIRVLSQTFTISNRTSILICVVAWFIMLMVKIGNGIVMLGQACIHVSEYKNLQARAEFELYRKRMLAKKSKSAPNSPRMSLIDFADVLQQQNVGVHGFTASDLFSQLHELQMINERRSTEKEKEERTPRRTQSAVNITRERRENSEPPPPITEEPQPGSPNETILQEGERRGNMSPIKKSTSQQQQPPSTPSSGASTEAPSPHPLPSEDPEGLAAVTAYTMPEQGVKRIE